METTDILIAKHILGTISESELEKLTSWRLEHPKNETSFQQIIAYVANERKERTSDKPLFKEFIQVQLVVNDALQNQKKSINAKIISIGTIRNWVAAACVGIIMFFSFQFFFTGKEKQDEVLTQEVTLVEKKSPNGRKLSFTLRDGTKVRLNSGSKVIFPSIFEPDLREVVLEGEAFFEVAKDSLRPFKIKSGSVLTTVLGTAFNIKAYPENDKIEVAVVEGKVKVEKELSKNADQVKSTLFLTPLEMGVYQGDKSLVKKDFDPEIVLGWTNRKLIFQNSTFPEIINNLEKWYGFSFQVNKKIEMEQGYNAEFENQSLKSVLESMKFSIGFQYSIDYQTSKVEIK